MKVNVLRINDGNLSEEGSVHTIDYNELIKNKVLVLVQGEYIYRDDVIELFQDNFDFLRITTKSGDKFRISSSKDVNLDKDLKTQQVKDVLNKLDKGGYSISIEVHYTTNEYAISTEHVVYDSSYYFSEPLESLEDFILRIGKSIINNK